jgi:predicted permease
MAATTTMLSIADAVLLRPPPIVEPDGMVSVWELRGSSYTGVEGQLLPYPRYEAYRAATRDVFEDLAGHGYRGFNVVTEQGAVVIQGFITSGNYFTVLGVTPRLGRLYDADDEASVVLSERLWRSRFGADPGVVGRTISLANRTYTIAGVAATGFTGTMSMFSGDLWVPGRAYARLLGSDESSVFVVPIGRLLPGIDRAVGEERVAAAARSIPREAANDTIRGARFDRLQWRADSEAVLTVALAVLLATAALVLLIACANIAAMTVARSHDRRREVAVRLAIGAGRGRLVRQMLAESVLLALVGGAGGILLAYAGTAALSSMEFPLGVPITLDATPDRRVLLASFALAAMTGVLFGLRPALRAAGADLTTSLKEGAQSPRLMRRKNVFVMGQLTLATLLLVTGGLFVRSFVATANVPLGFDPVGVQVASVSIGGQGYSDEEGRLFFARLLEQVRSLPGVEAAGLARWVLLGGGNSSRGGRAIDAAADAPDISIEYNTADPGFFEANRVELVEGRFFAEADGQDAPRVAVVNLTLAERLWPGESALGRTFRTDSDSVDHQVVGVVRNGVYVFAAETPQAYSYHPFAQDYRSAMALHVRSAGTLAPIAAEVRDVVRALDPNVALGEWRTMQEIVSVSAFLQRFPAWLSTLFALIGLGLGAMGVYGLLAVQVAQRTREFGVRMALGAKTRDVMLLVLGRGARVAAIGCAVGIGLSAVGGRWLTSLLYYAVSPYDAVTFVLVPVILIGAVALASVIPARRATRASPAATLREE